MGKGTDLKQEGIKVILDKERTLLFDLNTLVDLEEEYGDIEAAMKELTSKKAGKMKTIRKFLWLGLKHEEEELTEKQAGALIPFNKLDEMSEKLLEALDISMPDNKNSKNQ
jgi:hypothetical protein